MKEWIHYIPVKIDLSVSIDKTKWCLNNYNKTLTIAENALQFIKYAFWIIKNNWNYFLVF